MKRLSIFGMGVLAAVMGLALAALPSLAFAQSSDDGGGAAALFGGIFGCVCWIIGLAIEIGLTYWVYTDAKKRGNPNAVLWAVLTFLFTLLGLILYFLIGRNQGTTMGGPPAGPADTTRY